MPRFAVLARSNAETESGKLPSTNEVGAWIKFSRPLLESGVFISAEGLSASSHGVRISASGVVHGPFPPSEGIAGIWVIEAGSLDEAISHMQQFPIGQDQVLEVRPVQQMPSYSKEFGDELKDSTHKFAPRPPH